MPDDGLTWGERTLMYSIIGFFTLLVVALLVWLVIVLISM